jgi:hypothetical protein
MTLQKLENLAQSGSSFAPAYCQNFSPLPDLKASQRKEKGFKQNLYVCP